MIPLMNVARQHQRIKEELDAAALEVLASGQYIMGVKVRVFEEAFADYIGAKYAVAVGNGTDALVIALEALGIQAGDEVIVPGMSFFSTAEAVSRLGGKPVFIDIHADDHTLDESLIRSAITKRTKAIIPVHLYGYCANMNAILDIACEFGLPVVEDAAQAAGAQVDGHMAGSMGDIGCFSFFPTKNLGCAGDGGMITTNDEALARKCRAYRVHGSGLDGQFTWQVLHGAGDLEPVDFKGHLPKYFNFVIGHNSRLDELQAALLHAKLSHLSAWNNRRREIADIYSRNINNPAFAKPVEAKGRCHVYYTYVLMTEHRDDFREYMKEKGIGTGVYFPVPLHLQKVYEELGYRPGDLPNSEAIADYSVSIPMFPELTDQEIETVVDAVNLWEV